MFILALVALSLSANAQLGEKIRDSYITRGKPTTNPATFPTIAVDTLTAPWTVYKKQTSGSQWVPVSGYYETLYGSVDSMPAKGPDAQPFITYVPSGTDDRSALQSAFDAAGIQGRSLYLWSLTYKLTNAVFIDKFCIKLIVEGNLATIEATTSNPFTLLDRENPVNNNEALNGMVGAQYIIKNLRFKGFNSQVGFEPGPSHSSLYEGLRFTGLGTGCHLRFALNTDVTRCFFENSVNGLLIGYGDWQDATNFNSQSNHTRVDKCEFYMPSNGNVACGFYGVSGSGIYNSIIEGYKCVYGILFDGMESNVVKDFTIENIHFECPQGASGAFIKTRLAGGIITIDKCFGQYASMFLDASSTSGLCYVEVAHVPWWVGQGGDGGNGTGKCFRTSNIALHLEKNHAFNRPVASMWDGAMPTPAGNPPNEGNTLANYHTYTINRINPF